MLNDLLNLVEEYIAWSRDNRSSNIVLDTDKTFAKLRTKPFCIKEANDCELGPRRKSTHKEIMPRHRLPEISTNDSDLFKRDSSSLEEGIAPSMLTNISDCEND